MTDKTPSNKYPHCVLAYEMDHNTGALKEMRLLTPEEFEAGMRKRKRLGELEWSWRAYSPERRAPADSRFTHQVNERGMEARVFEEIMSRAVSVDRDVIARLNTDLRRLRIDGWEDAEGYINATHKQMIDKVSEVRV